VRRGAAVCKRPHLRILLLTIAAVQLILFLAYPMGGLDDDQAYQRYVISRLHAGDWHIGNVRYNTGYALFITPVTLLAERFGRLEDRVVLLVQVALSSLIPLLAFDAVRRVASDAAALAVAMLVLLDPLGLQWAHMALPVWLVALAAMFGGWFLLRDPAEPGNGLWSLLAGAVLGFSMVARINATPLALGLILLQLANPRGLWRWRVRRTVLMTVGCLGLYGAYLGLIHVPTTGTWQVSCILGTNLLAGDIEKGMSLAPENGPATRELLHLEALPALQEIAYTSQIYSNWRLPGSWATPGEQVRFLAQPVSHPAAAVIPFPGSLYFYLGPCPTDALLRQVHLEALKAEPFRYAIGVGDAFLQIVSQHDRGVFHPRYLPSIDELRVERAYPAGFAAVSDPRMYTGQIVWLPGVAAYSIFFAAAHGLKLLAVPALAWGLLVPDHFYRRIAAALVLFCGPMAAVGSLFPRTYSPVYPFTSLLIGAFLVWLVRRVRARGQDPPDFRGLSPAETRRS
jgi:hypothetical protein